MEREGDFLRFSFCGEFENAQVPCSYLVASLLLLPPNLSNPLTLTSWGFLLLKSLNDEMKMMKIWAIGFEHYIAGFQS
jgi:hypothetical protein